MECWCKNYSQEVQVRFSKKFTSVQLIDNKQNPYVIHDPTDSAMITCHSDKCNDVCGGADTDRNKRYGKCRVTKYKDSDDDDQTFVERCHCLILHKVLKPMKQG